jgi:hypothetical protein
VRFVQIQPAIFSLFLLSSIASGATVANSALTKDGWTVCDAPTPAYSFSPSDPQARLWFILDNVNVGDVVLVQWIDPSGNVYRSGSYAPAPTSGRWCYGDPLAIANTTPAAMFGQWSVKVTDNGQLLSPFPLSFNIIGGSISLPPIPSSWLSNLSVVHVSQPEKWLCGPSTVAMWTGFINHASYDPYSMAQKMGVGQDGASLPTFLQGMFDQTPYGYVYSSVGYSDDHAAVKGIMWTIARFNEPVSVVGGNFHLGDFINFGEPLGWATGLHYLLVRGGRADKDPYAYYGDSNHITGVFVNDATENSPKYSAPVSGMRKDVEYPPARLMQYWGVTGAAWYQWWEKRHTSIERECFACWSYQGQHLTWDDSFTTY